MSTSEISTLILSHPHCASIYELDGNFQYHIYDGMIQFVQQCKQRIKNFDKLKFRIGLVPSGHYYKEDGAYGERGVANLTQSEIMKLPPVPENYELFNIRFTVHNKRYFNRNFNISKMRHTSGPRGNDYVHHRSAMTKEPIKYGKYKKDGFDDIHTGLEKIFGKMEELKVLDYFDEEHQKELYDLNPYTTDENCLESLELNMSENVDVILSFTTEDLTFNTEMLIEFLILMLD